MKKKFLSVLLAAAMVATLAACGGGDGESNSTPESPESSEPSSEANDGNQGGNDAVEVTPEAIPDPYVHYTFDEGAGEAYKVVEEDAAFDATVLDGGVARGIKESADSLGYADGPVGQAIYLDGKHGLDLNFEATNTDAYTVSYWMNADRLGQFGPTLQMGYNIGKASDIAWMNVTQTDWGEADSANKGVMFPVIWSRNQRFDAQDGTECFPWMQVFDQEIHGKREWAMITIVATGEKQNGLTATGIEFTRAQVYVNGVMMYDSQTVIDEQWGYDFCLSSDLMKPGDSEFEAWFGINYWDVIYKGFVDEFYVFDSALTPGQVLSLYQLGDPTVNSVAPEGTPVEEEVEPVAADHSNVTTTGTVVGATDCSTPFWSEFSDVVEVPNGESVTVNFVNYTSTLANWHNFLVVLQNVPEVHSADANADYKEYAVLRADNWGWGAGYENIAVAECDWNWDTFTADMDGASVELTITNNGDTADVVAVVTTASGTTYNQKYTGIAVDGDLYYCLTVEAAFLDIQ